MFPEALLARCPELGEPVLVLARDLEILDGGIDLLLSEALCTALIRKLLLVVLKSLRRAFAVSRWLTVCAATVAAHGPLVLRVVLDREQLLYGERSQGQIFRVVLLELLQGFLARRLELRLQRGRFELGVSRRERQHARLEGVPVRRAPRFGFFDAHDAREEGGGWGVIDGWKARSNSEARPGEL